MRQEKFSKNLEVEVKFRKTVYVARIFHARFLNRLCFLSKIPSMPSKNFMRGSLWNIYVSLIELTNPKTLAL